MEGEENSNLIFVEKLKPLEFLLASTRKQDRTHLTGGEGRYISKDEIRTQ